MSTTNTDLLWIFVTVFYAVAAVSAVLAVVGVRMLFTTAVTGRTA